MSLVDGVGSWVWVNDPMPSHAGKPALFIDRDGVVTQEVQFLRHPSNVALVPGAAETIATFNRADIPVIVVTNQSGIARDYFTWDGFARVQTEIRRQLAYVAGAHLDAVFACGYHRAGVGPLGVRDHAWRKPNPGMLLVAAERLGVCLGASWIVGDRARDLAAGRAAGLAGGIHVTTGHGTDTERRSALALARPDFLVRSAADLSAAIPLLDALQRQGDPAS